MNCRLAVVKILPGDFVKQIDETRVQCLFLQTDEKTHSRLNVRRAFHRTELLPRSQRHFHSMPMWKAWIAGQLRRQQRPISRPTNAREQFKYPWSPHHAVRPADQHPPCSARDQLSPPRQSSPKLARRAGVRSESGGRNGHEASQTSARRNRVSEGPSGRRREMGKHSITCSSRPPSHRSLSATVQQIAASSWRRRAAQLICRPLKSFDFPKLSRRCLHPLFSSSASLTVPIRSW